MSQPFFFGSPQRALFGTWHSAGSHARGALVACPPLLQEGIRSHRALWALGEALAGAGIDVLRFDWHGSGDSAGAGLSSLDGLLADLTLAEASLPAMATPRGILGLRSSALPVLAFARDGGSAVNLVLWDPWLDGRAMLDTWQGQHAEQLSGVGRFIHGKREGEPGELMGFDVPAALLSNLAGLDFRDNLRLAEGSRVLLAVWKMTPAHEAFRAALTAGGTPVDVLVLEADDQPPWQDPQQFEGMAFPRRSVAQLARHLAAGWP